MRFYCSNVVHICNWLKKYNNRDILISAVRCQKLEIVKVPRLIIAGIQGADVRLNLTAEVFVNTTGTNKTYWPVNNITLSYYGKVTAS